MCGESRQEIGTGKENRKRRRTEGIPSPPFPIPFFYFLRILFFLFHAKIIKRSLSRKIFWREKEVRGTIFFPYFFLKQQIFVGKRGRRFFRKYISFRTTVFPFPEPISGLSPRRRRRRPQIYRFAKKSPFLFFHFSLPGKARKEAINFQEKKSKSKKTKRGGFFRLRFERESEVGSRCAKMRRK